jgi:PhnB protein
MAVSPIPEGFQSIIPSLNVRDGEAAIAFYAAAFGAHEKFILIGPDGKVMHSELLIGDCVLFLADEAPEWDALSPQSLGGCPMSLNLYTEDCDALTARAVAAGATILREPTNYSWGERSSMVLDPYGYRWGICSRVEEVSPEEIARRLREEM